MSNNNNNPENYGSYYSKSEPYTQNPSVTETNVYATAVPIPARLANQEIPDDIVNCYRLSKTVMLFAAIDIFFSCFYAFYSLFYLVPLIIAIYGYYSAKRYNAGGVLCYTIYQILINFIRITLSVYAYVLIRQDDSVTNYAPYDWYIAFAVLSTLLGLYIARFGYKLYKAIKQLNYEDVQRLIMLNYPVRIIYW